MNFTEIETVEFELNDTITEGVEKNIKKGYSLPVSVNDEEVKSSQNRRTRKKVQRKKPVVWKRRK